MAAGTKLLTTPGGSFGVAFGPTYTEAAASVQDQKVIAGLPYLATYSIVAHNISFATANAHILQVMAGASLNVYILRVVLWDVTLSSAGSQFLPAMYRLTSAGSGGTGVTGFGPFDLSDAAPGATAQTLPSAKGTEANLVWEGVGSAVTGAATTGPTYPPPMIWDFEGRLGKPVKIPAGVANGIAIKNLAAATTATCSINFEFVEAPF